MSTQLQLRKGNTAQTSIFTGAVSEVTVDTDLNVITVHDGVTPGGHYLSSALYTQAAFDKANVAFDAAGADLTAISANIAYLLSIDDTQNTAIDINSANTIYLFGALNATNSAIVSANTQLKTYTDGAILSANNQLRSYTDGAIGSANNQLRSYTNGAIVSANNQLKSYTDGAIASANNQLKSYTDGAIASANNQMRNYADGLHSSSVIYNNGVNSVQNNNISIAISLAQNAYDNSNTKLNLSGGEITGDLIVDGQANVYNRLSVGQGAYTILPNLIAQFTGTSDFYSQINNQNLSGNGTGDIVVTANNGTDLINYIDMGIAGSTYNNQGYNAFSAVNPNDGYFLLIGNASQNFGGNVVYGTTTSGYGANQVGDIVFVQGQDFNEVARFKLHEGLVIETGTHASDTTTGALVVNGGVGVSGSIYAGQVYEGTTRITTYVDTANTFLRANDALTLSSAKSYTDSSVNNTVNYFNGVNTSQNNSIDTINSNISYISGVNVTQNTRLTNVENTDTYLQGALDQANSDIVSANTQLKAYADGAISSANTQLKSYVDGKISYVSGVDVSQNTRLTNVENTDVYLQGALDQANSNIVSANTQLKSYVDGLNSSTLSYVAGVDASQNTRLTNVENTDTYLQGALNQANANIVSANTQLKSYVDGQVSTLNSNISYVSGVDATQNTRLDSVESNTVYLFGASSATNSAIVSANTQLKSYVDGLNSSTLSYTNGVNVAQNTRLTNVENTDVYLQGALDQANSNIVSANTQLKSYTDGAIASANTQLKSYVDGQVSTLNSNISYISGVDVTQNTRLTNVENTDVYLQGALNQANANIVSANTQLKSYVDGALQSANNWLQSNDAVTLSVSKTYTDNSNTQLKSYADGTFFQKTGGEISGPVTISANVIISGNLTVTGNVTSVNANNLALQDNMIYLNHGDTGSVNPDLGVAGAYDDGTYHHAGFFRDASDGVWKVFDSYEPEPDYSPYIDTSDASFRIASFEANTLILSANPGTAPITVSSDTVVVNLNADLLDGQHGTYYSPLSYTQAAFDSSNTTLSYVSGVNVAQNTRLTNVENTDVYLQGALNQANANIISANTQLKAYTDGAIVSANTQLKSYVDGLNSSTLSYVAGVDASQNTRLTNVENTDVYLQGALNSTNSSIVSANTQLKSYTDGAISSANTQLKSYLDGQVSTLNSSISYISGVDASQNTRLLSVENTNIYLLGALSATNSSVVSANTQLKAYVDGLNSSTLSYVADVDAAQNTRLTSVENTNIYLLGALSATNSSVVSANTQLKSYVDGLNSSTLSYVAGVDASQNTRITNVENTNIYLLGALSATNSSVVSANTQLKAYVDGQVSTLNSSISYISGVDAAQNTRLTNVENTNIYLLGALSATNSSVVSANTQLKAYVDGTYSNATNLSTGTLSSSRLPTSGVSAGVYGGSTNIPIIVVDTYGRVTSASNTAVSTTINLTANTGTGSISGGGTLTVNGANPGITTTVSGSTITITNSGVTSVGVASSTRLTTTASTGGITLDLAAVSGLSAGTYSYPSLQVDSYGRITTISNQTAINSVAGVPGTTSGASVSNTQIVAGVNTAGGVTNAALANSSITINGTAVPLGGTASISAGATITDDTTSNATRYLMLGQATSGSYSVANTSSTKLTFNPSSGTLTTVDLNTTSDENLKENIQNIQSPIDIINQIQGVSFNWKDSGKKSYGVIAQELEKILPELVNNDNENKTVSYIPLIAFLIEIVKDQEIRISNIEQK